MALNGAPQYGQYDTFHSFPGLVLVLFRLLVVLLGLFVIVVFFVVLDGWIGFSWRSSPVVNPRAPTKTRQTMKRAFVVLSINSPFIFLSRDEF